MFSYMRHDRCGKVSGRGRCQFLAEHGGLHTLVWPSGDHMVLRTWSGPDDENDDALDYPYPCCASGWMTTVASSTVTM
jgi:hypothetical protein